jgi:hypothetical protein
MRNYFAVSLALCGWWLVGCKSVKSGPPTPVATVSSEHIPANYTLATRNNSLSLLHQLLSDEKNVSKLLIIKRERAELHDLIKRISTGSGEAVKMLERFAKEDSSLNLKATNLPPGEQAARAAESKSLTKELLHTKGGDFEFALLLCQAQALAYGEKLATVAASTEPNATRRQDILKLSERLSAFYQETAKMMRQPQLARSP